MAQTTITISTPTGVLQQLNSIIPVDWPGYADEVILWGDGGFDGGAGGDCIVITGPITIKKDDWFEVGPGANATSTSGSSTILASNSIIYYTGGFLPYGYEFVGGGGLAGPSGTSSGGSFGELIVANTPTMVGTVFTGGSGSGTKGGGSATPTTNGGNATGTTSGASGTTAGKTTGAGTNNILGGSGGATGAGGAPGGGAGSTGNGGRGQIQIIYTPAIVVAVAAPTGVVGSSVASTNNGSTSSGGTASHYVMIKGTVAANTLVTDIQFNVQALAASPMPARPVIYADDAGGSRPGTFVAVGDDQSYTTNGIKVMTFSSPVLLTGTSYWFGFQSNQLPNMKMTTSGGTRNYNTNNAGQPYASGPDSSYPSSGNTNSSGSSVYAIQADYKVPDGSITFTGLVPARIGVPPTITVSVPAGGGSSTFGSSTHNGSGSSGEDAPGSNSYITVSPFTTPAASLSISQIDININSFPSAPLNFRPVIYTDSGSNAPNILVGYGDITTSSSTGILSAFFSTPLKLNGSTKYWFGVQTDQPISYFYANPTSSSIVISNGGGSATVSSGPPSAFGGSINSNTGSGLLAVLMYYTLPDQKLTFTGYTPTITVTGGGIPTITVDVPAGLLSLTGKTPVITVVPNGTIVVNVPLGTLTLTGFTPVISVTPVTSTTLFKGILGETVIVNRVLTTDERQKLEGYLAWKWGVQSYLPPSHPWVAGPPTV